MSFLRSNYRSSGCIYSNAGPLAIASVAALLVLCACGDEPGRTVTAGTGGGGGTSYPQAGGDHGITSDGGVGGVSQSGTGGGVVPPPGGGTSGGEPQGDAGGVAGTGGAAGSEPPPAGTGGSEPEEACGNGVIDPGEACDGSDLAGATCESLNLGSGTVLCDANCQHDTTGCDDGPPTDTNDVPVGDPSQWNDPGDQPFVPVPEGDVAAECKMDINLLNSGLGIYNHAVIRYGKLCYSVGSLTLPADIFSATKTVSGVVMGAARWDTRENDRVMFPSDLVSDWSASTNPNLRISHLASMVANSLSLEWGSKTFAYDTLGTNLARTGPPMEASLGEGSVSGATSLFQVKDNLFRKLGITGSWAMAMWGTGAQFSISDMARLGLVMIHGGWYNGEQVVDPDWIYWMTHPPWEDANTSYGMYTWLNHRGNATGIGGELSASGQGPSGGDPCAPAAIWQRYPHPPSEATDCFPEAGNSCEQKYDTGVFSAQGLGGQFIVGHRGLDLVIVVKNYSGQGGPLGMWEAIRPAVVALDPEFQGDEAAFCEAYGNGNYAPDLLVSPVQPDKN